MSVDTITKFTYLVHGKKAPSHSSFKGVISTKSIIGFKSYGKRKESKFLSNEAKEVIEANKNFFNYTSERLGATKTYSSKGWIDTPDKDKEFRNEIENNFCRDGDILWVPVLSLKDFVTSKEMKMFNEEDYAAVFDKILPSWFQTAGFKNDNMLWWMDHHVNTDNPHIHFCFLEKDKTKTNGKLPMKDINNFKSLFWKEVFSKKRYLEETGKTVAEGFKNKDILKQETYKTFKAQIRECSDQDFISMVKQLYSVLPTKGRLQYNSSHMIPYRERIDEVVDYLLRTPEVNKKYTNFKRCVSEFDDIRSKSLNTKYESIMKSEDKKLRSLLANTILSEFKELDHTFWEKSVDFIKEVPTSITNSDVIDNNKKTVLIPIAKSLIRSEDDSSFYVRIPGTNNSVYIDKGACTLISTAKMFRVAEITFENELDVFDESGNKQSFSITTKNALNFFSDGQPYLDGMLEMERNRELRNSLWQTRRAYYAEYLHDWNRSSNNIKKATFSWINEIEQEVNQARNEYLNGREVTL